MSIPINIQDLLSGKIVEGTRMEFKQGWNPTAIMRTICAFANDFENEGSGYVIIGVSEKDGKPIRPVLGFNPTILEQVEKELVRYCNLIQPTYFPRLSLEEIDGKHVLVIWVPAGANRPYKVPDDVLSKHKTLNYRIRFSSNSVIPNDEQEAELIQLTAKTPFDDRVSTIASISDLSKPLMREHLEEINSRLYEDSENMSVQELAEKMNVSQGANEHLFPKNIGLLMFSKNPQKYFKGAIIEVVEFPNGLTNAYTEKTFDGTIQKQLIDVLSYIKTNVIKTKVVKYNDREKADRFVNYPYDAIEEALANAVYHKNYELLDPIEVRILPKAIEIISYNGVDPSIKQSEFEMGRVRARRYRNRRVGEFLKELQLTEGRGTGIPTIINALKENGSPAPKFDTNEPERTHFIVEIPIHESFKEEKRDRFILNSEQLKKALDTLASSLNLSFDNFQVLPPEKRIEKYLPIAKEITEEQTHVLAFVSSPKKRKEILEDCLGLSNQTKNFVTHIEPLLEKGLIQMTIKDKPKSQFQKYLITNVGKVVSYILENNIEDNQIEE
jgi:ATP-dependent DNA helicase RecG